jgi:hypothetical protein
MRYRDAFTYVFQSQGWIPSLLILALASLVPLIGPIFAFGYVAVVIESLRWGQSSADYHKIQMDRLQDYLLRGLRVFLVSVLAALALIPFYIVFFVGAMIASAVTGAAGGDSGGGAVSSALGCVFTVAGGVLVLAFALAIPVLLVPLQLRASLNPDLKSLFSFSYVRDFVRRMWRESLLCYVVLCLAAIPIAIVGMLALFVGIFVAIAYIYLVQAHLLAQLADMYEARGGESIGGVGSDTPTPPPLPT